MMSIGVKYGMLIGKKTFHLEIASGVKAYFYDDSDNPKIHIGISSNIGLRIQKPGGRLVFRLGGGYPDLTYIGFGLSF